MTKCSITGKQMAWCIGQVLDRWSGACSRQFVGALDQPGALWRDAELLRGVTSSAHRSIFHDLFLEAFQALMAIIRNAEWFAGVRLLAVAC